MSNVLANITARQVTTSRLRVNILEVQHRTVAYLGSIGDISGWPGMDTWPRSP